MTVLFQISGLDRWVTHLIESAGLLGVGLLMFLENVIVFIPSELIMPLAGFYSEIGRFSFWGAVISGTIGSTLGTLLWYWLGRRLQQKRFERFIRRHGFWFGIEPRHIHKAERWFERRGMLAVTLARLTPAVRTFISIPAGMSRMPLIKFVPLSLAGSFAFNLLLAEAGRLFGSHFREIGRWIHPLTGIIIGATFAWWLYRVVRIKLAH